MGQRLHVELNCKRCEHPLTIQEVHYLDTGMGFAHCSRCETELQELIQKWRALEERGLPAGLKVIKR